MYGWGEEAIRVARRLAGARHTGQDEKDVLQFQWGRLARSYKSGRTGAARPLVRHILNLLGKSFQQKKRDLNYLQWLQSY